MYRNDAYRYKTIIVRHSRYIYRIATKRYLLHLSRGAFFYPRGIQSLVIANIAGYIIILKETEYDKRKMEWKIVRDAMKFSWFRGRARCEHAEETRSVRKSRLDVPLAGGKLPGRSLAFDASHVPRRKSGEKQRLLRCVPTRILRVSRLRSNRVSDAGNRETHANFSLAGP